MTNRAYSPTLMFLPVVTVHILACTLLAGCGNSQDPRTAHVVVYTSVDRVFAEPVLRETERSLGIKVVGVYDTEETKSTGLVNRLLARRANPDGDIFWSGDPGRAASLSLKGIFEPYLSPEAALIPGIYKNHEGFWTGFSARARVLLVNSNLVGSGSEPSSIHDLTLPEWKGRVAIANPLFGTTSFHIAALFEVLGEARAKQWLDDLAKNGVQLGSSNGDVKRRVSSGQVAVGLVDTDDAAEAIAAGEPVRAVFLDQTNATNTPLGALIIPNTISLIRNGPNTEPARKVIDYLLSERVQVMLAQSCAQAPLRPNVSTPPGVLSLDGIVPMNVDYNAVAERLDKMMPLLKQWSSML